MNLSAKWTSGQKYFDISSPRPIIKVVFAVLSFILLLYVAIGYNHKVSRQIHARSSTSHSQSNAQILGIESQKHSRNFPVRLKIPKLNIDAAIEYVGLTPDGEMAVPQKTTNVGWYDLGPRPGEKGSAVIAGHLDGETGVPGVFANLNLLRQGDKLSIEDANKNSISFVVRKILTYDPGHSSDVFNSGVSVHLNLITCDGIWDGNKKSYTKRLVVFTDISE